MPLNVESLSSHEKTVLLARLASKLTVCARDTYEVGTDRVRILKYFAHTTNSCIASQMRLGTICWEPKAIH